MKGFGFGSRLDTDTHHAEASDSRWFPIDSRRTRAAGVPRGSPATNSTELTCAYKLFSVDVVALCPIFFMKCFSLRGIALGDRGADATFESFVRTTPQATHDLLLAWEGEMQRLCRSLAAKDGKRLIAEALRVERQDCGRAKRSRASSCSTTCTIRKVGRSLVAGVT